MPNNNFQQVSISTSLAEKYALEYYGLKTIAKKLPGETDFNFHLKTESGEAYTLKISRPGETETAIDFEAKILAHLSIKNFPYQIPKLIPALSGRLFQQIKDEQNQERWMRLQTWVEGRMLDDVNPRSMSVLKDWGATAGQFALALADFDHPHAHRFYKWNPSETLYSKKHQQYIYDKEQTETADYFWNLFKNETLPKLGALRKSVNYNDAHEHNLLVNRDLKNPKISGVIDFGDALYTHTINELAIACAYAAMYFPNPLEAAAEVVRGFHTIFPLEEKEVDVLYSMIAARLMITAANAAWNKHQEPDNEYLLISEKPAWALLEKWRNIPPALAHYSFRAACNWDACPKEATFKEWLSQQKEDFAPVVNFSIGKVVPIDLRVGSLELGNNSNFNSIQKFERKINRFLEDQDAAICFGGYNETRPFYTSDAYQVNGNSGAEWRTVHLGMDFWMTAASPVFAPLAGRVHSVANNDGHCNYGPTIILEHQISTADSGNFTFYSLYGHLSLDSIKGLQKGMPIQKGQQIARIGSPPINGNWPPHLHFQVLLNLLDQEGDFPGVAFPNEKDIWLSICPDPASLMQAFLPNKITKEIQNKSKTLSSHQILETRNQFLGKNLSISYQKPLHIVRGFGQYLYDSTGRRYLDTVNNVAHVGHEHPSVVKAAQQQSAVLNTNTRYLHDNIVQYAKELLSTFPPELSVVHFVNSGSEANELALRMAKAYSNQKDMLALEVGYHGNTGGTIDISSYKFDGKGGKGAPAHTHILPMPDVYRGLYRNENAAEQYANHAKLAIEKIKGEGRNIAGFIAESILSCGGQVILPLGYLAAIYEMVRTEGGLCIADEVQVGFGRTGDHFWAFELQNVIPDIVTMGKPIGNGHPLAAVVTTKKVAETFANGMEYFNTFGGNPVSCAIGREVLKVIANEGLQQNAKEIGRYLTKALQKLKTRFPIIGDVRGIGFFQGIELVKNRETLEPAAAQTAYLANRMRERGILMSTDGPLHNVLKIKPPMCFTKANVDFLIENLELVLRENFMQI
ncbi:MAG: 4-aminobutyrate aminotransferase-like enzyme/Ser/Thr protein kinase RdoA (MazF antagonist) [Gammaproteobacteria bacterium]|jgi:4-aminobutyrate aminotransferase-like enzyme/Ser/Thr protein kinase RdoA (MazF antagonist)